MQSYRFEPPFYDAVVLAQYCARDEQVARVLNEGQLASNDDHCWEQITQALRHSLAERIEHESR
jgi:hypothetical protein